MRGDPTSPSELPEHLMVALEAAFARDEDDRRTLIEELVREHPDHADLIRSFVDERADLEDALRVTSTVDTPTRIGPYRILGELGEGGMGTVYLAERREPIRMKVALKVVKAGMDTRRVLQRFEMERQALAIMEHDNISKVLDAGSTEQGRPYFVMELVKGVPITEYCDQQRLSVRDRLGLFLQVCSGVQHAHQKGVIHRDLKPSNILVTLQGGDPVVKIIDFGLSRATGMDLVDTTMPAEVGAIPGTPPYMSPEQCGIGPLDLDTRTDIYSLGVVLYELLTDQLPFSPVELQQAGLDGMVRLIRETDPKAPSTRISNLRNESATLAHRRRTDVGDLLRTVRGDLDWITMRALAKDRTHRYETAAAFADDLVHYLRNEPVDAGPPSMGYVLRKFIRRNRGKVVSAALLFVTVVVGAVVSTVMAIKAERALAEYQKLLVGAELDELEFRAGRTRASSPEHASELERIVQIAESLLTRLPKIEQAIAELREGNMVAEADERARDRGFHPEREEADRIGKLVKLIDDQVSRDRNLGPQGKAIGKRKAEQLTKQLAEITERIEASKRVDIAEYEARFLHDWLELTQKRLRDLRTSLLPDLKFRLSCARRAQEQARAHEALWTEAIDSIAASERYEGLERLTPQIGLVPVGPDPRSGLWEFAHIFSGDIPERDEEHRLELGMEHGIVFVLLPPGNVRFLFDDNKPPKLKDEAKVFDIEAMFLAKHEMNRAQWQRLARGVPGLRFYEDCVRDLRNIEPEQLAKPAVLVSWQQCHDLLHRYGLTMPKEEEWEYACKAGTTSRWHTGNDVESLHGFANILDQTSLKARGRRRGQAYAPFEDGYVGLATTFAKLKPNDFGLHQMHGNAGEWCLNVRRSDKLLYRGIRGGSWNQSPEWAASTVRNWTVPNDASRNVGVRPARRIQMN